MAFSDEIKKLQRVIRPYVRFSTGTGSDNPGVSGSFTDRRFGKVADNTGTVPIKPTVEKLGTFTRALTNFDQDFEIPSIQTSLFDKANEWRVLAARPWQILNRFFYYVIRVLQDDGTSIDSDITWGQMTQPEFPATGKVTLRIEMLPGDHLGKTVPRRTITKDDWPNADTSAVGKAVPIIYGQMDNSVGTVQGFTGTLQAQPNAAPTGLAGSATTGGQGAPGTWYYAIAAVVGGVLSELSNVVAVTTDGTNDRVNLTWNAYAGASAIRVYRGNDPSFLQFNRYRLSGYPYSENDLAGGATSVTDDYAGYDTTGPTPDGNDPHWDLNYRNQMYYYVSAVVNGAETPMSGPVTFFLAPLNRPRTVSLSWSALPAATSYKVRRLSQAYHFAPGWDREWTLSAATLSLIDTMNDTSAVNIPESATKPVAGALEALYVDTNPAGTAGQYKYVIAGHGCKSIQRVYVTKSKVTASGGKSGSINRPTGLALNRVGAAGTTQYRYVVTATNANGETTSSSEVRTSTGNSTLDGSNYNALTWDAVDGASGYKVYRAGEGADLSLLATTSGTSYDDQGTATPDGTNHPPEHNTTGDAYASGQETSPPEPVLQTKNVDYFVEVSEVNGHRYQIIRFNASQEGNPVTVDVHGVESLGTATGNDDGGTLITDGIQQFKHFLLNWVFNSYLTGSWYTDTGFQSGLLDTASFDTASTVANTRISGGYVGAGALTEIVDVRQSIRDWLTTFDLDWYFWNGKFKVRLFNPSIGDRSALPQYTQKDKILRESFESWLDVTKHANQINWQGGPQFDGYFIGGKVQDTDSQSNYGRIIESEPMTMSWTRDAVTAGDVAQRRQSMVKNPPVKARFAVPLSALNDELGTLIAVTHKDGIYSGTEGWVRRACKILRSDIDFDRCIVVCEVQDIDTLVLVLGYAILGDRGWTASDKVYATAVQDKKDRYWYLSDRSTGRFSNSDLGKKLASR